MYEVHEINVLFNRETSIVYNSKYFWLCKLWSKWTRSFWEPGPKSIFEHKIVRKD